MKRNKIKKTEFKHSPDYRSILFKGKYYTFTSNGAKAVRLLHEQYLKGTPDVGNKYILKELGIQSKRFRDIFQHCVNWRELIIPGEKKGTHRLNL